MKSTLLFVLMIPLAVSTAVADQWVDLFDGESTDNWVVRSGTATYHVEDGAIVGTTVEKSGNTFLCTQKEYEDFILEFEVKVDMGLNSGVQFRSRVAESEMTFVFRAKDGTPRSRRIPEDRVYGYQVEISKAENENSGGIYDEARRGFFLNGEVTAEGKKAFEDHQWNKYRVECRGSSIKTYINGVLCADFRDSLTPRGIIGLQVHGMREYKKLHVRWRNIRIQELK